MRADEGRTHQLSVGRVQNICSDAKIAQVFYLVKTQFHFVTVPVTPPTVKLACVWV